MPKSPLHQCPEIETLHQYKATRFAGLSPEGEDHNIQVQVMLNIHAQRSRFRQTNISSCLPGHCPSALCCALGSSSPCLIQYYGSEVFLTMEDDTDAANSPFPSGFCYKLKELTAISLS